MGVEWIQLPSLWFSTLKGTQNWGAEDQNQRQGCLVRLRMHVPSVYTALALAVDCWFAQWEGTSGMDLLVENMPSMPEILGSTPYYMGSRVYMYFVS